MSKRAEEAALKVYPVKMESLVYQDLIDQFGGKTEMDVNTYPRCLFQEGYEQAEKGILPAAAALVEAVEQYVEPKPGTPYLHRTKILAIKNKLKEML